MSSVCSKIRGGIVLGVTLVGDESQFTEIHCIHPETFEERALTVWTTADGPLVGDQCFWHPGHSPGWAREGEVVRRGWLPRVGRSRLIDGGFRY